MKVNEQDTLYDDPRFEMFSNESEWKALLTVYGAAFGFIILIVMPWAVGSLMLLKWMFF